MIAYLIKSGLCLVVLLAIYLLFLEREKMHQFNRFFLLFALMLGLIVPFINFEFFPDPETTSTETQYAAKLARNSAKVVSVVTTTYSDFIEDALDPEKEETTQELTKKIDPLVSSKEIVSTNHQGQSNEVAEPAGEKLINGSELKDEKLSISESTIAAIFSLKNVIIGLNAIVTLFLLIRLIYGVAGFYRKRRSNPLIKYGSAKVALLDEPTVPHTFLNTIYVNKTQFESGELSKEILDHELTHARQKHSWDVLFIELLRVVFWFNPVFYFYKRAIQINHEFLADESVISKTQDSASYQKLLLDSIFPAYQTNLASTFNYSLTKKRFKMMVKESSILSLAARKIILLPVILSVVLIFCTETKTPDDVLYPSVKLSYGAEEINGYMHTVAKNRDGELFTGTQIMRFKKDDRLFGHTNYKNGIAESATRFDSTGARIDHFNYTTIEGDFRLKDRTIIVDDKEVLIEEWIYPHETEDGIGSYKQWHKNGVLKSEATFRKGFQYFGLVTVYDEYGKIIEQARYEDGKEVEVIVESEKSASKVTSQILYPNNPFSKTIDEKTFYYEISPTGYYYEKKLLVQTLKIANASDARFYNEEGEPFSGTQRLLNLENNSLKIETEVDEGVIKSRTVFHDTGEVHNRIEYEYRGDTLVYSKSIINGKLFQENFYPSISESGMLVTKTYFPNGQIQHESQQLFVDETGSYHGLMTLYDEEGNILEQDLYDNGKLVKNLITSGRSRDIVTPDNKKLD